MLPQIATSSPVLPPAERLPSMPPLATSRLQCQGHVRASLCFLAQAQHLAPRLTDDLSVRALTAPHSATCHCRASVTCDGMVLHGATLAPAAPSPVAPAAHSADPAHRHDWGWRG